MDEFKYLTEIKENEIFWRETPDYIKITRLHPDLKHYLKNDTKIQFDILDKITHKRVLVMEWTCNGDTLQDFQKVWKVYDESRESSN